MKIYLVYQNGLANVFQVDCFNLATFGRNAKRLFQGPWQAARAFACGAGSAGAIVRTAVCDRLGDIAEEKWYDTTEHLSIRMN